MFYALRTQQVTNTSAERQLLVFYTKKDRAAYLEAHRSDVVKLKTKEASKFSTFAPGCATRCQATDIIFFVYTLY